VRRGRIIPTLVLLLLASTASAWAQRLPITAYTTADGLLGDRIRQIVRDSRGYLWICQRRGLSRFDGQRFKSYGPEHGLPEAAVSDLLETSDGTYLLATGEGVYRFDPLASEGLFARLATGETTEPWLNSLAEDSEGRLWAGTDAGLHRLELVGDRVRWTRAGSDEPDPSPEDDAVVNVLLASRRGDLWIGKRYGLDRRAADGRLLHYSTTNGLPGDDVRSLLEDREGRIWVGTTSGLARLVPDPAHDGSIVSEVYLGDSAARARLVSAVFESTDGRMWIGTALGLGELAPDGTGKGQVRWFGTAQGLSQGNVVSLADDPEGNLWIATEAGGVMRLVLGGLVSYAEPEGIENPRIGAILETRSGELCISAESVIYCYDEGRFHGVRPNVSVEIPGWGWHQWVLQDHAGDWWIPTGEGLYRFTGADGFEDLGRSEPSAVYTRADGLGADMVFRLYEDSRGDIWIGTLTGAVHEQITRWNRRSGQFQRFGSDDHDIPVHAASAFREDRGGNLWIGFYEDGVARFRDGRFEAFSPAEGCPRGFIRVLHLDRAGRLWIGTSRGGVARIDDPASPDPEFETYTKEHGLSSNLVSAIVEDERGRLYFGTDRGIDRFDPSTGRVRHFTTAHGLPNSFVNVAHRAGDGSLWFGTLRGLARLVPTEDRPSHPPPVFIHRVRIAGDPHLVSELGATEVPEVRLRHNRNRARIEFGGISFRPGAGLRYQYRLEGVDGDWSEPSSGRSVDYANLAPGSFRFQVRAVATDGQVSPQPASFAFTVLRPFWQRGWFILLVVSIGAAIVLAVHRLRVARAVELERVRTRIATDLHDDIGSSLSRIAILSEVAQRSVDRTDSVLTTPLARIAAVSRELVDSMSDIVWAIDPKRDRLSDVVFRMRRFAADAFTGKDVAFSFRAPSGGGDLSLGPDVRRELYLVFKEAVNNAVRHSGCAEAKVELRIDGDRLRLEIRDDGQGFDPAQESEGHGLGSMKRRAEALGGKLEIVTRAGEGTTVRLEVPIGRGRRARQGQVPT
jgi:ligand-binding sensor domain-containing protein/two-component sensor histidine kinase